MKALVISGGGSKGVFSVGVVRHLYDKENVEYDIIAGVSVGALNAAMLASGPLKETIPILEKIWFEEIKNNSSVWTHYLLWHIIACIIITSLLSLGTLLLAIFDAHWVLTILGTMITLCSLYLPYYVIKHSRSVYRTKPLRRIVRKYLKINKLKNSGKKLLIGAVSHETGEYRYVDETNPYIEQWIMASSAFPVLFPLENIEGSNWIDGGVINIVPLYDVIEQGALEIDVILSCTLENKKENRYGVLSQLERAIDLMTREIVKNDIVFCKNKIKIRIFEPEYPFEYSSLEFNPKYIKETYEAGKQIAQKVLEK